MTNLQKSKVKFVFKYWQFMDSDLRGRLGGLAVGWNPTIIKVNEYWGCESVMGINFLVEDIGLSLIILNVYVPYGDKKMLQDVMMAKSIMRSPNIIIGGISILQWKLHKSGVLKPLSIPLRAIFFINWNQMMIWIFNQSNSNRARGIKDQVRKGSQKSWINFLLLPHWLIN